MANQVLAQLIGNLISSGVGNNPNALENPDFNSTATDANGQLLDKYTGLPATSSETNAAPYKAPTFWQRAFSPEMSQQVEEENAQYYNNPINAAQARGIHSQDMAVRTQNDIARADTLAGYGNRPALAATGAWSPNGENAQLQTQADQGAGLYGSNAQRALAENSAGVSTANLRGNLADIQNNPDVLTPEQNTAIKSAVTDSNNSDIAADLSGANRGNVPVMATTQARKALADRAATTTAIYNNQTIPGSGVTSLNVDPVTGTVRKVPNPLAPMNAQLMAGALGGGSGKPVYDATGRRVDNNVVGNVLGNDETSNTAPPASSGVPQTPSRQPMVSLPDLSEPIGSTQTPGGIPSALHAITNALTRDPNSEGVQQEGASLLNNGYAARNNMAKLFGGTVRPLPDEQSKAAAQPTTPADIIAYKQRIGLPVTAKDLQNLQLWQKKTGVRPAIGQLVH